MSLQQKLSLKLQQKIILTPTLQQAIRLLQLTRLELQQEVSQELQTNPVLEENTTVDDADPAALEAARELPENVEADPLKTYDEKIDVESYFQDYLETNLKYRGTRVEVSDEGPDSERYLSAPESLSDHLEWQVGLSRLTVREQEIARIIIGNLREDGYLTASVEDLAQAASATHEEVASVFRTVQQIDPVGAAARDLKECLSIQLTAMGDLDAPGAARCGRGPALPRKGEAVPGCGPPGRDRGAARRGPGHYPAPGPETGPQIQQPRQPDDRPRCHRGEGRRGVPDPSERGRHAAPPDQPALPHHGRRGARREAGEEAMAFLKEKVRSAMWFLKSVEERQRTIYKVAKEIVEFQRDFLDQGPAQMRPLILRDVAERVGVHESTVSRVVSNKYMQTPRGILPMKYFFSTGIGTLQGADVSSLKVKERLKVLVDAEDPQSPHSATSAWPTS